MGPRRTTRGRRGTTLVETMIAVTLFCAVAGSAILAARGGRGAFEEATRNTDVETRVRRALDRAAYELVTCIGDELQPQPVTAFGTSDLIFRNAVGLVGAQIVPGQFMRLVQRQDPGDPDDGVDNDGDGLVDEGRLVLVRDDGGPAETSTVLCNDVAELLEGELANGLDDNGNGLVDERGFCIQREGDLLVLRLSLQSAGDNTVITRTLETAVGLRN